MSGAPPDRYIEINRRMGALKGVFSASITLLMLATAWGDWRRFGIVAGLQCAVIAFNVWTDLRGLKRFGRRFEIVRVLGNIALGIPGFILLGWPLPIWLYLPFIALAYDHFDKQMSQWVLAVAIVVFDTLGLAYGTPWIYPVGFTVLAIFCAETSRHRHAFIREMLAESESQREKLEQAHAELVAINQRLAAEVEARKHAEHELVQAQKLEAVGRLAAGVAHEINTPIQFVGDSIQFVREGVTELLEMVPPRNDDELAYLAKELPESLVRAHEGLRRVARIVRALKVFAHNDAAEVSSIDLNNAIDSTLIITANEYRYVAELQTELAPLPPIQCVASEVNQAILNLVVNAAHAIEERCRGTSERGTIRVSTRLDANEVVVSISDNGAGIPEHIRPRIFEMFFTTKPVGKGTGQGLSLVHSVAAHHGGSITYESVVGQGTTFHLRLPLKAKRSAAAA